jgi:Ca-activated chloride channel family protein
MRIVPALAVLAVLAPASILAQTPRRPTFEVGIDVTNLDVSVREGRNYVGDLTQGDFAVYEDGVRQDLSLFIHERLPISLAIMLDVSASMSVKLPIAQKAATRFLATLQPGDKAEIVSFNSSVTTLVDFTEDRLALEAAIARTESSGATALHNALYVALKELGRQKTPGQLRRRAIVLLSDGEDTASLVTDEQIIELARKTEVGIYAISLRSERKIDSMLQTFSQAAYLLTTLAQESGGRVYFPSSLSELDEVYGRIAEEIRTLYSIGYLSNNKKRDGKWRRIVVRVPTRTGLEVRHKIGYFGPKT